MAASSEGDVSMTESGNTCTNRQVDSVVDAPSSFVTPPKKEEREKHGKRFYRF